MVSFKELLEESFTQIKDFKLFFLICWFLLLAMDLASYFFQKQFSFDPNFSRYIEVGYQLILVYLSVCFFHGLSFLGKEDIFPLPKVLGEGILLTPGFILQSLFFGIAVLVGLALLVVPGLVAIVLLYFNPLIAVIYPDYEGKMFFLGPDLIKPHWGLALGVIFFTGVLPLIPEGIAWLASGSLKSWLTPILAPIDGALFIFCELVAYQFIFSLVQRHRESA